MFAPDAETIEHAIQRVLATFDINKTPHTETIRSLHANGIRFAESAGFIGTSIEAVLVAHETGQFPVARDIEFDGELEYLHFIPAQAFIDPSRDYIGEIHDDDQNAIMAAKIFGKAVAERDYTLNRLGLELNSENWELAFNLSDKHISSRFSDIVDRYPNIHEQELRRASVDSVQLTRGVLLSLSLKKSSELTITPGAEGVVGFQILSPNGLSLEYFDAIEPIGDFEEGILQKILQT